VDVIYPDGFGEFAAQSGGKGNAFTVEQLFFRIVAVIEARRVLADAMQKEGVSAEVFRPAKKSTPLRAYLDVAQAGFREQQLNRVRVATAIYGDALGRNALLYPKDRSSAAGVASIAGSNMLSNVIGAVEEITAILRFSKAGKLEADADGFSEAAETFAASAASAVITSLLVFANDVPDWYAKSFSSAGSIQTICVYRNDCMLLSNTLKSSRSIRAVPPAVFASFMRACEELEHSADNTFSFALAERRSRVLQTLGRATDNKILGDLAVPFIREGADENVLTALRAAKQIVAECAANLRPAWALSATLEIVAPMLERPCDEVLKLKEISAGACEGIESILDDILEHCESFRVLAGGGKVDSSVDARLVRLEAEYETQKVRAQNLKVMMDMRMDLIVEMFLRGKYQGIFSKDEIVALISSIFEDTPMRTEKLRMIEGKDSKSSAGPAVKAFGRSQDQPVGSEAKPSARVKTSVKEPKAAVHNKAEEDDWSRTINEPAVKPQREPKLTEKNNVVLPGKTEATSSASNRNANRGTVNSFVTENGQAEEKQKRSSPGSAGKTSTDDNDGWGWSDSEDAPKDTAQPSKDGGKDGDGWEWSDDGDAEGDVSDTLGKKDEEGWEW